MSEKIKLIKKIGLFLVIIASIGVFLWFHEGRMERLPFNNEAAFDFNEGWMLVNEKGEMSPITIPGKTQSRDSITILTKEYPKEINEKIAYAPVLGFRSAHQKVKVFIDEEEVYHFGYEEYGKIETAGSAWNFVRLPKEKIGSQITIVLESNYSNYNGIVNSIYIGSKAALLFKLLSLKFISFCISMLMFLLGIGLIGAFVVYSWKMKDKRGKGLLYLGSFSMLLGTWSLGETQMMQFFTGDLLCIYVATFISVLLMPIPLLKYFVSLNRYKSKKYLNWMIHYYYLQFIVFTILQMTGVRDYVENVNVYFASVLFSVFVVTLCMCHDYIVHKNKDIRDTLITVLLLMIFGFMETIWFYSHNFQISGNFIKTGVLIFIMVQAYSLVQKQIEIYRLNKEAKYYEELAMKDATTRCLNRRSFEDRIQKETITPNTMIIMVDINNLKIINDDYGHQVGDDAIKRTAHILMSVFGEYGECYRIGGDEFLIWSNHLSEKKVIEMIEQINNWCDQDNEQTEYDFGIALGWASYNTFVDNTIQDTIKRADQNMYQDKEYKKGIKTKC